MSKIEVTKIIFAMFLLMVAFVQLLNARHACCHRLYKKYCPVAWTCNLRKHDTCTENRYCRHLRNCCSKAYFHHHDGHHARVWHKECHPAHDRYGQRSPYDRPRYGHVARYNVLKQVYGRYMSMPHEMGPNI